MKFIFVSFILLIFSIDLFASSSFKELETKDICKEKTLKANKKCTYFVKDGGSLVEMGFTFSNVNELGCQRGIQKCLKSIDISVKSKNEYLNRQSVSHDLFSLFEGEYNNILYGVSSGDINSDGYNDLLIRIPGIEESSNLVWLYNKEKNNFKFIKFFEFEEIFIDKKSRSILERDINGFSERYYKFSDDSFILTKEINREDIEKAGYTVHVYSSIKEGKKVVIKKSITIEEENPFTIKLRREFSKVYSNALRQFRNKQIKASAETLRIFFEKYNLTNYSYEVFASTNKTLNMLNDYGFFLEQAGYLEDSIQVLEIVKEIDENRIVVYLNLADAQFKLSQYYPNINSRIEYQEYSRKYYDFGEPASLNDLIGQYKLNYGIYTNLMTKAGKQKKIPTRVFDRLK